MQLQLRRNNTPILRGGIWYIIYENIQISRVIDLSANDYLSVYINLGAANNIAGYNDHLIFLEVF